MEEAKNVNWRVFDVQHSSVCQSLFPHTYVFPLVQNQLSFYRIRELQNLPTY